MRPGKLTGLAARNLRRNLRYHLLAGTAIAVGVAAFAFFLGLGEGVQARVVGPLAETLPPSELEVKPKKVSLGVFQLDRPSLFGGARFDDAALEKLAAIPGVTAVHGTMNILFPIMAWGRFFGKGVRTDLIVTGVDERLVRAELGPDVPFAYEEGQPVPLVASPHLLELYNASFAKMNGLPQVTPEILKGLRFNLVLGKSYLAGTPDPDKVQTVTCEFVGFSRHAVLIGASVPLAFVRAMNARFVPREAGIYRSAVVSAASANQTDAIAAAVEAQGLEVASEGRDLARRVEAAVTGVTVLLSLIGLAMILVAGAVIALTFSLGVVERKTEFGLLRALGATRGDVALLLLAEAAVVGLLAGLIGLLLSLGAAGLADALAATHLPDFPYKPDSFFLFPAGLLAGALGLAVGCAALGALPPARRAAHLDPAAVLAER